MCRPPAGWAEGTAVTDVTSGSGAMRLRHFDRVYVGWRYAQIHPEPGPPPRRPAPPESVRISQEWLGGQRRGGEPPQPAIEDRCRLYGRGGAGLPWLLGVGRAAWDVRRRRVGRVSARVLDHRLWHLAGRAGAAVAG